MVVSATGKKLSSRVAHRREAELVDEIPVVNSRVRTGLTCSINAGGTEI